MMKKTLATILAATALTGFATSASATTLLESSTPTAPGTTASYTFQAGAGAGTLDLVLLGLGSINGRGQGSITDTFTFLLNGAEFFRGSFNLSGGGRNSVVTAPRGSHVTVRRNHGFGSGGTLSLLAPLTFVEGTNTLTFNLHATSHSERFQVGSIAVDGLVSAVPEPEAWAMMLLGFFTIGGAMRMRKSREAAVKLSYS